MNRPRLRCAISDRNAASERGWEFLLGQAGQLAEQGIDLFQLREKDLPAGELARLGRALLAVLRGSPTKLLINGRLDVAVAIGADGVHLTSHPEELTQAQVYRLYRGTGLPAPVITASCHTLEDVERRRTEGVDALLFGPVFEKVVYGQQHSQGCGVEALRSACLAAGPVPVLAIGGITAANTSLCVGAGASGVAGIRLFQMAS